ncbi:sugar phosphate isomerase/epimerase [Phenylobacterium sp. J367]|uniref:sugar phosphate isomerase/epimerase family protein n=1 Tax=Phenylobacterium sp. J367 TaxID=2898435 RepID=UPI00215166E7|nr:hypothetical protein [Phenylobacterium sp. J367]MCR5881079.1 hypothetical protein [Phenylobacterium sp. J367]
MRTTTDLNRRGFLLAGGALAGMAVSGEAAAAPFFASRDLPIGIQLYTLGPDAAKDLDGTLAAVAKIGYRSVELAGLYGRTPQEFKASLDKAGLKATSAHVQARGTGPEGSLEADAAKIGEMLNVLGVKNAVMPSPYVPQRVLDAAKGAAGADYYRTIMAALTADDYRFNADFLNQKAAILKKAGVALGYHNHNFELAPPGRLDGSRHHDQGDRPGPRRLRGRCGLDRGGGGRSDRLPGQAQGPLPTHAREGHQGDDPAELHPEDGSH